MGWKFGGVEARAREAERNGRQVYPALVGLHAGRKFNLQQRETEFAGLRRAFRQSGREERRHGTVGSFNNEIDNIGPGNFRREHYLHNRGDQ